MIQLKCPACGGVLTLDETREVAFCEYCGQKLLLGEKKTVSVEGTVAVEGVASVDNLLIRARQFYNQGYIDKADEYYNRVLDLDPYNSEATEGVALCAAEKRAMYPAQPVPIPPAKRMAAIEAIRNAGGNVRIKRPAGYDAATTVKVLDAATGQVYGKIKPKQSLMIQLDVGRHDLIVKYPLWQDINVVINVASETCTYDCQIVTNVFTMKGHVEVASRDLAL